MENNNFENKKNEIDITINININKKKVMINGAIYSFIFQIFEFIFLLLRIASKIK